MDVIMRFIMEMDEKRTTQCKNCANGSSSAREKGRWSSWARTECAQGRIFLEVCLSHNCRLPSIKQFIPSGKVTLSACIWKSGSPKPPFCPLNILIPVFLGTYQLHHSREDISRKWNILLQKLLIMLILASWLMLPLSSKSPGMEIPSLCLTSLSPNFTHLIP